MLIHVLKLAALGGFILIFGFLAFNGSSQASISNPGDGAAVAMAIKNTVMSATSGAFTTMFLNKLPCFGDRKWSFATTLNGALVGMVSSCKGFCPMSQEHELPPFREFFNKSGCKVPAYVLGARMRLLKKDRWVFVMSHLLRYEAVVFATHSRDDPI